MIKRVKRALGIVAVCGLAGCGGTSSPLLGTAQSPRVRALNIVPASPALSVQYDAFLPYLGSIAFEQQTPYSTENEGSNTVSFLTGNTTSASYNGVFQYSDYYTVIVYTKAGQLGTFAIADNNINIVNGQSQIRVVDAITVATLGVDVYVNAGSTSSTNPSNLISSSPGLAFGTATAYQHVAPGTYTVTVTPTGIPGTILLNTTLNVGSGQSESIYALDGSTSVTTNDNQ